MQKFKLIYLFAIFTFLVPFSLFSLPDGVKKHFDAFFKGKISDETKVCYFLLLKKVKNNEEIDIKNISDELKTALTLDLERLKREKFYERSEKIFALLSSYLGGGVSGLLVVGLLGDAVVNREFSIMDVGCGLLALGIGLPSYFAYKYSQRIKYILKKNRKIQEREKIAQTCEVK